MGLARGGAEQQLPARHALQTVVGCGYGKRGTPKLGHSKSASGLPRPP